MADEYFSYDADYNFRDRDALLLGEAVKTMSENFESFWNSPLAAPVETLYDGFGLMQKNVAVSDEEIQRVYRELHDYARVPDNFAPEVRAAIAATPKSFARVNAEMSWGDAQFIHDMPGKNKSTFSLGGGGRTTAELAKLVAERERIHPDSIAVSGHVEQSAGIVQTSHRARRSGSHQHQFARINR